MIKENQDLQPFNTFGISVKADLFSSFDSVETLDRLIKNSNGLPLLILGGGSNVLFTRDYHGLVLKNEIKGFDIISENNDSVIVRAGAGEIWHEFVLKCIDKGFGGIENLSLIPGSVGASPMQNIGAYGVEIKDVFHSLSAYHLATGEIHTFDKSQCEFGYRESVFKRKLQGKYVIIDVSFELSKNPKINSSYGAIENELKAIGISSPSIKDISNAVTAIRSSKLPDPKKIGNAGSFFKNPILEKKHFSIVGLYKLVTYFSIKFSNLYSVTSNKDLAF